MNACHPEQCEGSAFLLSPSRNAGVKRRNCRFFDSFAQYDVCALSIPLAFGAHSFEKICQQLSWLWLEYLYQIFQMFHAVYAEAAEVVS